MWYRQFISQHSQVPRCVLLIKQKCLNVGIYFTQMFTMIENVMNISINCLYDFTKMNINKTIDFICSWWPIDILHLFIIESSDVLSTICTLHCLVYYLYFTLYCLLFVLYSVLFTVCTVYCLVYCLYFTLYCLLFVLYSVLFTICTLLCLVYCLYCILSFLLFVLYFVLFTICTLLCLVYCW